MTATLTPHEDAVRRVFEKAGEPTDPFYRAALVPIRTHQIECARLLDQGRGSDAVLALTVSVATSIIDSIASSAASGHDNQAAARVLFINTMMIRIATRLAANSPESSVQTDIHHGPDVGHA